GLDRLLACRQDLERCIAIFRAAGEPTLEGRSWNELGASFKAVGDWTKALACYVKDEAICQAQDDQHGLAASRNNLGEALNGLGRYAEAERVLAQAVVGFAAAGDLYEQADALANLGNALAGLGRMEEAAAAYRRATHCVEAVRRGIDAPDARVGFFGAQTRIYGRRLAFCLAQDRPAEAFYVAEQARARGMLELLGDGLPQAAPLTAEEALALLPADTGLLVWFALDAELVGFALSHESGLQTVHLGIAPNAVFNGSFDSRGLPRSLTPDLGGQLSDPWLAPHLFERLVAPLLAHVSACRRLVLIPHGSLHWLPLHASLDRRTGRYLYEMYDLLYAPSAAIQLSQLQARRVDASRRGALALALQGEALHHVAAEVQDVARFTGGLSLVGPEATFRALVKQGPRFRWLHLAGHAHYLSHAPLQSGVDLADGRLTAEALLAQSDLGFALAWVNGCESGRARVHPGDELLGFVRGLLAAVAPSLMLALWPVNDLAARVFARLFYTELMADTEEGRRGMAALLRRACTRMRQVSWADLRHLLQEDGHTEESIAQSLALLPRWSTSPHAPFAHPYYWAAYFLVGERWAKPPQTS
ncbi:MAG: CHAT domain-containing protein, partial [Caldilineae bacterium]